MIKTNILVVGCDRCGTRDIFQVEAFVDSVRPKFEDLTREGWTYSQVLDLPAKHYCKACSDSYCKKGDK